MNLSKDFIVTSPYYHLPLKLELASLCLHVCGVLDLEYTLQLCNPTSFCKKKKNKVQKVRGFSANIHTIAQAINLGFSFDSFFLYLPAQCFISILYAVFISLHPCPSTNYCQLSVHPLHWPPLSSYMQFSIWKLQDDLLKMRPQQDDFIFKPFKSFSFKMQKCKSYKICPPPPSLTSSTNTHILALHISITLSFLFLDTNIFFQIQRLFTHAKNDFCSQRHP